MYFLDRADAGRFLAVSWPVYKGGAISLSSLCHGAVCRLAMKLRARSKRPLDVFMVRKLGVPGREELAMGAVASGGVRVLNAGSAERVRQMRASAVIEEVDGPRTTELLRREQRYRGQSPFPELAGKTVVLVDDGLATGATMRAAARCGTCTPAGKIDHRGAGRRGIELSRKCGRKPTRCFVPRRRSRSLELGNSTRIFARSRMRRCVRFLRGRRRSGCCLTNR